MLKVAKFGGSSVSDAGQFRKVKDIVESDPARRIVVSSACGKRSREDHKMTDLLYLCHAHLTYGVSCDDIWRSICDRFVEIRDNLGLSYRVENDLESFRSRMNADMSVDELVSRGEYFTSRLMAEYLGFYFLDAKDCIFMNFDGTFDAGKIASSVQEALERHDRIVVPGFYGRVPSGKIKVMSRGGSDITGALVAAAANADLYENWTDVSGILMADPRIVEDPRPIPKITYAELRELAFMGASVLHEDSIQPVKEALIPLNIRNTNSPEDPGTMIVDRVETEGSVEDSSVITGVSGRRNFAFITVRKRNIISNSVLRKTLEILDKYNVPVEHITLGLDSFAFVASQTALGANMYDIISEIQRTTATDNVQIEENIALVAAVGRRMSFRPGTSGKFFSALGSSGVNIRTISQSADELSIIIGVDNSQYEKAVRVLYEGFTKN